MSSSLGLADFYPGLQESLIENRGSVMIHEVGVQCTCRLDDTYANLKDDGQSALRDPFCPRCRGDNFLYRAPQLVKGLATSIRQQRNILDAGIAQPGDMQFSPEIDDGCTPGFRRVGAWDKLTATWDQPLDGGQVILRGAGTANENKQLRTYLKDNEDRLWYEPSTSVWCEDENGVQYTQDADFELGPGKIIRWIGNQPAQRLRYTMKYNAFFEWIVYQPPQERRDKDNADIGQLCFLRKKHVMLINTSPFASAEDHVSFRHKCST